MFLRSAGLRMLQVKVMSAASVKCVGFVADNRFLVKSSLVLFYWLWWILPQVDSECASEQRYLAYKVLGQSQVLVVNCIIFIMELLIQSQFFYTVFKWMMITHSTLNYHATNFNMFSTLLWWILPQVDSECASEQRYLAYKVLGQSQVLVVNCIIFIMELLIQSQFFYTVFKWMMITHSTLNYHATNFNMFSTLLWWTNQTLYTRYPIVARAIGLARAKVSCIQIKTITLYNYDPNHNPNPNPYE